MNILKYYKFSKVPKFYKPKYYYPEGFNKELNPLLNQPEKYDLF